MTTPIDHIALVCQDSDEIPATKVLLVFATTMPHGDTVVTFEVVENDETSKGREHHALASFAVDYGLLLGALKLVAYESTETPWPAREAAADA